MNNIAELINKRRSAQLRQKSIGRSFGYECGCSEIIKTMFNEDIKNENSLKDRTSKE